MAAFYSLDGSLSVNDGAPAVGRDGIREVAQGFMTAFPDMQVLMDALEFEGGQTVYHWTLVGTNTGPGGTGNRVRISGFEQWRIGADGLIAESQGHFDAAEYQCQLEGGSKNNKYLQEMEMVTKRTGMVAAYAHMWPREIFDAKDGNNPALAKQLEFLTKQKGVYILYRDELPHYIGKSADSLFNRLYLHAVNPKMRNYNFWNFFSAFAIPEKENRDELEGILIAAMPTANSSRPRLNKEKLPNEVVTLMKRIRYHKIKDAIG